MAHILLAEDDPDIRDLVDFRLASRGHTVVAVADGTAASLECRDAAFDLLITDITMPGMDGISLVRWLRRHGRQPALPVLVISALSGAEVRADALAAGASAYLAKPFPLAGLVTQVEELLAEA